MKTVSGSKPEPVKKDNPARGSVRGVGVPPKTSAVTALSGGKK